MVKFLSRLPNRRTPPRAESGFAHTPQRGNQRRPPMTDAWPGADQRSSRRGARVAWTKADHNEIARTMAKHPLGSEAAEGQPV